MTEQQAETYRAILALHESGQEGVLVTVVHKEGSGPAVAGARLLLDAAGSLHGTVGGGALEALAIETARDVLARRDTRLVRYALSEEGPAIEAEPTGMVCGGYVTLFYEYLGPALAAYVYGAGHVGLALAASLDLLGARVTLIDPRADLLTQAPAAARRLECAYVYALQGDAVAPGAYHVIATPGHASDYDVLKALVTSGRAPKYVGMVASRRKAAALLTQLAEELGEARHAPEVTAALDAVYTPVGLDLGGRTPADIALSITAEIQAVRHGKAGHLHLDPRHAGPAPA